MRGCLLLHLVRHKRKHGMEGIRALPPVKKRRRNNMALPFSISVGYHIFRSAKQFFRESRVVDDRQLCTVILFRQQIAQLLHFLLLPYPVEQPDSSTQTDIHLPVDDIISNARKGGRLCKLADHVHLRILCRIALFHLRQKVHNRLDTACIVLLRQVRRFKHGLLLYAVGDMPIFPKNVFHGVQIWIC